MNVDKNNGEVRNKIEGQAKYLEESVGAVYIEEDLRRLEEENKYLTGISGIDDFILGKLKIYAGEIDPEKFRTGNYIIVGPSLNGDTDEDTAASAYYKIGDKVRVDWEDGTSKEYEVMAIGDLPNSIGPRSRFLMETDLIIPSTEYLQHRTPDGALSFALDCTDDEAGAKLGIWLEDYCENSVSTVFESRGTYMENFESMTNVVSNVGSALAFILALISILNFINSMVTSIFIRQRELAMLQSVGMTRRQMRRMLLGEGFGHILLGILLSALISSLVGYGLGMTLEGMVSFYSYRFVIWPILACTPILLLFAAAVPMIAFRMMCRSTVVERLRQID